MFGNYGDGILHKSVCRYGQKGYKDYSRTSIVAQGELKQSLISLQKD